MRGELSLQNIDEYNYHLQESPFLWLILHNEETNNYNNHHNNNPHNNHNHLSQLNINNSTIQNNKLQVLILITLIVKYSAFQDINEISQQKLNGIPIKLWR